MIAIHSFVEGGCDADLRRRRARSGEAPRCGSRQPSRFHVRPLAGRRRGIVVADLLDLQPGLVGDADARPRAADHHDHRACWPFPIPSDAWSSAARRRAGGAGPHSGRHRHSIWCTKAITICVAARRQRARCASRAGASSAPTSGAISPSPSSCFVISMASNSRGLRLQQFR